MAEVSRRSLLAGACAILALGSSALPAAAQGAVRTLPDGRLEVKPGSVPELATVGGAVRVGTLKGVPVAVARTGPSSYAALSLRCPHQGVPVTRTAQGWTCTAHGSQFEADGDLVLGPALTRLPRVPARMRRGSLVVG